MIIFIHTANSYNGVGEYFSHMNIQRRTFYHDYYVSESNISKAMNKLNKKRKSNLIHSTHGTTFLPFFPLGLSKINVKKILNLKIFDIF